MPDRLPDLPHIDSTDWSPPVQTDPIEISRLSRNLVIFADSDNSGYQDNVLDIESGSGSPRLNNWWEGHAPAQRELVLRKFWKPVPSAFAHLQPGTQLQQSWAYEHGVSTTDSESIAVQVGFSGEGFSAGLTATFAHSITVNDKRTNTTQYTVAPPASGTRVWVLWDLMYEFMLVRRGTNSLLPASGYRGDVDFRDDDHYSGAYLSYRWNHLVVSSGLLIAQSEDFH